MKPTPFMKHLLIPILTWLLIIVPLGADEPEEKPARKASPYPEQPFPPVVNPEGATQAAPYTWTARPQSEYADLSELMETPLDENLLPPVASLPQVQIDALDLTRPQDVSVILRTLSRIAGQNIIFTDNVQGAISVSINQNTPWDEVFQSVLMAKNLDFSWEGKTLRVFARQDIEGEIEFKKTQVQRIEALEAMAGMEPLVLQAIPVRYLDLELLQAHLKRLITPSNNPKQAARSYVDIDTENHQIIAYAPPADVARMQKLTAYLDQMNPQILIEAYIVETTQDLARELGLEWSGQFGIRGQSVIGTPDLVSTTGNTTLGDLSLAATRGLSRLDVTLRALESDNKLKILSRPSILVTNNQQASIESGEERAYRVTSGTGNDLDVSVEFKSAVLKLDVKPHVIDVEKVRLILEVNKDSFGVAEEQNNGQFPVNKKHASTQVILLNGQTTVLGGLTTTEAGNTETGIPILSKLPLMGFLFKGEDKQSKTNEIVIFITPYILQSGEDYRRIFRSPASEYALPDQP